MKTLILCISVAAFAALSAFKKVPAEITAGTYGVCDAGAEPPVVLHINADHTFRYSDKTVPNGFDITGSWRMQKGKVVLENYPPGLSIHHEWTWVDSENCIKSRQGMDFRRLCRCD